MSWPWCEWPVRVAAKRPAGAVGCDERDDVVARLQPLARQAPGPRVAAAGADGAEAEAGGGAARARRGEEDAGADGACAGGDAEGDRDVAAAARDLRG